MWLLDRGKQLMSREASYPSDHTPCHGCQSAPALALPTLSHLFCNPIYQHLQSIGNQQEYINSGLIARLCVLLLPVQHSVYLPDYLFFF